MKKTIALLIAILLLAGCQNVQPTQSPVQTAMTESPAVQSAAPEVQEEELFTRDEVLEYMQNDVAVDFVLEDLDGNSVSLADYRGKIILLNFWQTWCGPCQKEMPEFEKLVAENNDVIVLGVNSLAGEGVADLSQAEANVREFIADNGYTFPILIDPSPNALVFSQDLYISQGIPANYFIDREGILRVSYPGQLTAETLDLILQMMRALDNE